MPKRPASSSRHRCAQRARRPRCGLPASSTAPSTPSFARQTPSSPSACHTQATRASNGSRRASGRRRPSSSASARSSQPRSRIGSPPPTPSFAARWEPSQPRPKPSAPRSRRGSPSSHGVSKKPPQPAAPNSSLTNKQGKGSSSAARTDAHGGHDRTHRQAQRAGQGGVLAPARADRGRLPAAARREGRGGAGRGPARGGRARRAGLRPPHRRRDSALIFAQGHRQAGVPAKTPKGPLRGRNELYAVSKPGPRATRIAPAKTAAQPNANDARTPKASISTPPTAVPAARPIETAVLIHANASAAVPRRATESIRPYAAITAGAIGKPARNASTVIVGSEPASRGRASPAARRNAEIRSSRRGCPVARAPAISPPTRLPP